MARTVGPLDPADPPERHAAELAEARELLAGRAVEAEFEPAAGEPADTIVELAEQHRDVLIVH